ncbi:MAG: arginase family protein [Desulfurococcales archaeon]|nr:arginase family protein [Desulfurococcales archaeon]
MGETLLQPPGSPLLRDPRDSRLPRGPGGVALLGVPWDWNVSGVPGARLAPARVRRALLSLRPHAPGLGGGFPCSVEDLGDVRVAPGDPGVTGARAVEAARLAYRRGRVAAFLGGDHSITRWTIEPLLEGGGSVSLLVMDAHYDMRSVEEGLTSGSWLWEVLQAHPGRLKVAVVGVADYANPPYLEERARRAGVEVVPRARLLGGVEPALEAVDRLAEWGASASYISVDMDHLAQAHAPGVNAPNPLGLDPRESVEVLLHAARRLRPRGVDVVEVTPTVDVGDSTSRLAAVLLAYTLHAACS